ncbi:TadE family protein [Eubacteriales bacterium KG127]
MINCKIFNLLKKKKGSELIEATLVLPVVIIIILGLLSFVVIFYSIGISQFNLHSELIDEANLSEKIFTVKRKQAYYEKDIRSLIPFKFKKNKEDKCYSINEEKVLRMKDSTSEIFQD